jgi:GT2 family glycosyltransferase
MFRPVKIAEVELTSPDRRVDVPAGYGAIRALVRLHGVPIAEVEVPTDGPLAPADAVRAAFLASHRDSFFRQLLRNALAADDVEDALGILIDDPLAVARPLPAGPLPSVTAAVCTRDRTEDLARCLASLERLEYADVELMVVDNSPSDDATERLVRTRHPRVRYVREPRPGLDWARNRAIAEAGSEIVAFTDDDAAVDPLWAGALAAAFADDPSVMAVTGLVLPYELETEAQVLFERYGGFGRGFQRARYQFDERGGRSAASLFAGSGKFGTGANMAFRRSVFAEIGPFDPALDVGTVTNGGGDLEMFFRVLKEGHALLYEPAAVVRHRHRRDYGRLRTQLANNGVGFYSHLVRCALAFPEERFAVARLGLWWLWWWNVRRLLISFVRPDRFPRDLIVAELVGSFVGLTRYPRARRAAAAISAAFDGAA